MSAAAIASSRCSSHMKAAAQKKPIATSAVTRATMPPTADFNATSTLCLRLAIGPSNTGALPAASAAPCGAEQEAQPNRERDGRERMLLHRFLQRLAEVIGHLAQCLAAALADVGHGVVELVLNALRALPEAGERLGAAGAQQVADLPGEPGQIVTQGLHVALDVL